LEVLEDTGEKRVFMCGWGDGYVSVSGTAGSAGERAWVKGSAKAVLFCDGGDDLSSDQESIHSGKRCCWRKNEFELAGCGLGVELL
jgi:hypothetical protein